MKLLSKISIAFALLIQFTVYAQNSEETEAWLFEKLNGSAGSYDYKYIGVHFPLERELIVRIRGKTAYRAWLADLTPVVELDLNPSGKPMNWAGEYSLLTFRCTSGKCFDYCRGSELREYRCSQSYPGYRADRDGNVPWKINYNHDTYTSLFVPKENAERIQKAFSHLIKLHGGKEKVKDDLF